MNSSSKIKGKILEEINQISKKNNSPVVIQSDFLTLISKNIITNSSDVRIILSKILKMFGSRTMLMPTFVKKIDIEKLDKKIINLDKLKSSTGVLNEEFRKYKYTNRTISPTQPWSVIGKDKKFLTKLKPKLEWGKDSILEWIQKKDAQIIMLGVNRISSVLKHRVELLNKKYIKYRKLREYKRTIIHNKKKIVFKQKYFDKIQNSPNYEYLLRNKFKKKCRIKKVGNFTISSYKANDYIKVVGHNLRNINK